MVRLGAFAVGCVFVLALLIALVLPRDPVEKTIESIFHEHPKHVSFASDGPMGKFDEQQLQRGFQVYKEVCAACHSLRLVAFRDLEHIGFTPAEVKAIADQWTTEAPSIDPATGEANTRKNLPADKFPLVFPNEVAARAANNNAVPPDLSLIVKAREGGAPYLYSLLTGYQEQPAALLKQFPDAKTPDGLYYNPYFHSLNIAMAPPLTAEGQVTYAEGNPKPTVDQMAKDVSAFLVWAAEPNLNDRHAIGLAALIFVLFGTILAWFSYQNVWRGKEH